MNISRSLLVGMIMIGGSLVAVTLTASAIQKFAMNAESRRVAAWAAAAERQVAQAPPARASNIQQASLR
jgi:hypothetical protein